MYVLHVYTHLPMHDVHTQLLMHVYGTFPCMHIHTSPCVVCSLSIWCQFAPKVGRSYDYNIIPYSLCLHFSDEVLQANINSVKVPIHFPSIVVMRVESGNLSEKARSLQTPSYTNAMNIGVENTLIDVISHLHEFDIF